MHVSERYYINTVLVIWCGVIRSPIAANVSYRCYPQRGQLFTQLRCHSEDAIEASSFGIIKTNIQLHNARRHCGIFWRQ